MEKLMRELGGEVIDLYTDPANKDVKPSQNFFELLAVEETDDNIRIGPNGAQVYANVPYKILTVYPATRQATMTKKLITECHNFSKLRLLTLKTHNLYKN